MFIAGFTLVGFGLGALYGKTWEGVWIGLGAGLIVEALFRVVRKRY